MRPSSMMASAAMTGQSCERVNPVAAPTAIHNNAAPTPIAISAALASQGNSRFSVQEATLRPVPGVASAGRSLAGSSTLSSSRLIDRATAAATAIKPGMAARDRYWLLRKAKKCTIEPTGPVVLYSHEIRGRPGAGREPRCGAQDRPGQENVPQVRGMRRYSSRQTRQRSTSPGGAAHPPPGFAELPDSSSRRGSQDRNSKRLNRRAHQAPAGRTKRPHLPPRRPPTGPSRQCQRPPHHHVKDSQLPDLVPTVLLVSRVPWLSSVQSHPYIGA